MTNKKIHVRTASPPAPKSQIAFCSSDFFDELCAAGYTRLSDNPEVASGVKKMANLIGGMTIHVMENTNNGDVRVKDGLSRKLDIEPCENMTRLTWMSSIVRTLLLEGNGNAFVIPHYKNGLLESLTPVPYGDASIIQKGYSKYAVMIHGVEFEPDMLLHFVYNPDPSFPWKGSGLRAELRDIVPNLKQARITEKAFMSSKFRPSLIVKVDALTEEFSSKEGRKKLLDSYFETTGAGEPWLIPAEQFSVEQVKPLSIKDMAIAETQQLDIKTVAAILGVPPFFLGVGDFNAEAWNHTVNTTFHSIAQTIEQELTRKLMNLYSRVKRGDVSQCSFGFEILDEEREVKQNGDVHFTIRKVKLYEVSVVTFPAYKETEVAARKEQLEEIKKRELDVWKLKALEKLKGEK